MLQYSIRNASTVEIPEARTFHLPSNRLSARQSINATQVQDDTSLLVGKSDTEMFVTFPPERWASKYLQKCKRERKKDSKLCESLACTMEKKREKEKKRDKRTIVVNLTLLWVARTRFILPSIARNDVWHRNWNRNLFAFLPYILFIETTLYELSFVNAARTRIPVRVSCSFFFLFFFPFLYFSAVRMQCLIVISYPFFTLAQRAAIPRYTMQQRFVRLVKKKKKSSQCFRLKGSEHLSHLLIKRSVTRFDSRDTLTIIETSLWGRKKKKENRNRVIFFSFTGWLTLREFFPDLSVSYHLFESSVTWFNSLYSTGGVVGKLIARMYFFSDVFFFFDLFFFQR